MASNVMNPASNMQIHYVGNEKTPIVIIDNFLCDLTTIRQYAATQANFAADKNSYYPGQRAILPKPYVIETLQAVYLALYELYHIPKHWQLKPQDTYFSLITKKNQDLSMLQCLPHFDTSQQHYYAVLHYLADEPHGNTGLFRHKTTGFERISDDRVTTYLSACEKYINQHGNPLQQYCIASNDQYELYHEIEYKKNRLVIYPGNLLHSTLVNPSTDISDDPCAGRLTANIFIEFRG